MTPEPKYLAVLHPVSEIIFCKRKRNREKETKAYSNARGGTRITRERWPMMGKVAPTVLVPQMMKTEAMRRPVKVVAPPPEAQLTEDICRALGEDERTPHGRYKYIRRQAGRDFHFPDSRDREGTLGAYRIQHTPVVRFAPYTPTRTHLPSSTLAVPCLDNFLIAVHPTPLHPASLSNTFIGLSESFSLVGRMPYVGACCTISSKLIGRNITFT